MKDGNGDTALLEGPGTGDVLSFDAVDVTGTHEARATAVQRSVPTGAVARSLAARMSLPKDVPWSLHDSRGAFLDDERPIGEQVRPGETVTVAPKTHLG